MNVAVHQFVPSPDTRPSPLAVFELRAWARATLWQAGEFDLHHAVDVLQANASQTGLANEIGEDGVQAILADAFGRVRNGL